MPDGTGVWFGVNQKTFEAGHFARAAMEGVTLGMNYGLRRLAELGVKPTQIRATGGGAKSKVWRQIMADIFNAEVVTLKVSEGAAYGAALQALWCWRLQQGEKVAISDITDQFVELNAGETAEPDAKNAEVYRELQELQDELSIGPAQHVSANIGKFVFNESSPEAERATMVNGGGGFRWSDSGVACRSQTLIGSLLDNPSFFGKFCP